MMNKRMIVFVVQVNSRCGKCRAAFQLKVWPCSITWSVQTRGLQRTLFGVTGIECRPTLQNLVHGVCCSACVACACIPALHSWHHNRVTVYVAS